MDHFILKKQLIYMLNDKEFFLNCPKLNCYIIDN